MRNFQIKSAVTEKEKSAFERLAVKRGVTLSTLIRVLLERDGVSASQEVATIEPEGESKAQSPQETGAL